MAGKKPPELKHSIHKSSALQEASCSVCERAASDAAQWPNAIGLEYHTPRHCAQHCHNPLAHPTCEPRYLLYQYTI